MITSGPDLLESFFVLLAAASSAFLLIMTSSREGCSKKKLRFKTEENTFNAKNNNVQQTTFLDLNYEVTVIHICEFK